MNPEVETTIAAAAQKTAYAGAAGGGVLAWLTSDIIFGVIGVFIALAGTLAGMYYKRKSDRREAADEMRKQELHAARMAFMARARAPGPGEMIEANLLGIDTSDFGKLEGQDG